LKMTNTKRRRKRRKRDESWDLIKTAVEDDFSHDDPRDHFKRCVYYPVLDSVVMNLTTRYEAARNLNELFSVVWKYPNMSSEDVRFAVKELAERYSVDVTDDLVGELEHLKAIHAANLGDVRGPIAFGFAEQSSHVETRCTLS